MLKRTGKLWIILLLVGVIAAAGYTLIPARFLNAQEPQAPAVQTAAVRQGNITVSALGAGTVIAGTDVALSFQSAGLVAEVMVRVGDRVQAGDVLARLDDTSARHNLAQAELQVAQAALNTEATVVAQNVAAAELAVLEAEMRLALTRSTRDDLENWQPDGDAIALAEANLAAAEANYMASASRDGAANNSVTIARISLQQAQDDLAEAQEAYDNAFDPARDWERNIEATREAAAARLARAQDNLTIAQANYDSAVANVSYASTNSARASLLSAEQNLANLQTPPTADDLDEAQFAVQEAELAWQRAQLDLEQARSNSQSELSLAQARLNLATARTTLENSVLVAPMDGTVLSVAAQPGENVGTGAIITLANLEQPLVEVFLDETDLEKVGLDYEVEVIFDALPDEVFSGRITGVNPQLVVANGVSTIRAVAQLDADSFIKPQTLPIGLNATVEVIGGRSQNTLFVPVEALRELSPGQFSVFVMENGQPRLRSVQVGLMDFTFAEIVSGLEAGDVVTTGIVETQ